MLSQRVIMNKWRDWMKLRDTNTCIYVDKPAPGHDPSDVRPGSPARAPASLTEPCEP